MHARGLHHRKYGGVERSLTAITVYRRPPAPTLSPANARHGALKASEVFASRQLGIKASILLPVRIFEVDYLEELGASSSVVWFVRVWELHAVVAKLPQARQDVDVISAASCLPPNVTKEVVLRDQRTAEVEEDSRSGLKVVPKALGTAADLGIATRVRHLSKSMAWETPREHRLPSPIILYIAVPKGPP